MTNAEAINILSNDFEVRGLHNAALEAIDLAISALEKQEGKKPLAVETNIYDQEEIHHNCAVQILTNSVTGDVSVGWWKENNDEI